MNETRQRRQSLIMIDYGCRGKERSVFGIQEADTQIAHGEYWRTTQCPKPDGDKDVWKNVTQYSLRHEIIHGGTDGSDL